MRKTIIIIFVLIANYGYSCSCTPLKIKQYFNKANLIFTGEVVEIKEIEIMDSIPIPFEDKYRIRKFPWKIYKFKVIELIKGDFDTNFIEIKVSVGNSCSKHFTKNEKSLVFSSQSNYEAHIADNEEFQTASVCSGTDKLQKIKRKEFKKLRRLAKALLRRTKFK